MDMCTIGIMLVLSTKHGVREAVLRLLVWKTPDLTSISGLVPGGQVRWNIWEAQVHESPPYLSTVPSKISVFPAFPAAIIQSLLPMSIIKACLVIVRVLK